MKYQFIDRNHIESQKSESELSPEVIYGQFMDHTDECIYVVEGEILVGIVTPGDLYRFYVSDGESEYLNSHFAYVDEIDFKKAEKVFENINTIHEVPVIKNRNFIGIIKSGGQKSNEEWSMIREGFLSWHLGKMEWRKKEILKVLNHIQASIYVYFGFDEKKLKWSKDDWEAYRRKKQYPFGAVGLAEMSESEKESFFGKNYSEEYVESFIKEFHMLRRITYNGVSKIGDISGQFFNVSDGKRRVCSSSELGKRRIYFIGPCVIFGAYVCDSQTIESYLQEMVNSIEISGYEVQNCGMMGPGHFYKLLTEKFAKDDIIIYFNDIDYDFDYMLWEKASLSFHNIKMGSDISEAYNGIENPTGNLLNNLWHCNHTINKRVSDIIYKDIEAELKSKPNCLGGVRTAIQDYYIPWEIVRFYRQYIEENAISSLIEGKVGAIVMNCNPFTKGHRYLIEYASSKVDRLFVFVVEEDRSDFAFKDRFQMVKMGTNDLDNVYVMPSGNYIISKETFSQYFEKEFVTEVEDMSYDLHIFADVIAKEFSIEVRFVGEEPFDLVTSKYNETMKFLLPQKGIEVVEIPRLKNDEQEAISASLARRYIKEKKYDKLHTVLPESTIRYLNVDMDK